MTPDRFGTGADRYDAARPAYPEDFIARIVAALPAGPGVVLDVGAGTGILTRQLSAALPGARLVGLEPSDAMRAQAETIGGATYGPGLAEALPLADGAAKAVVAGAAAHWFDRPLFYRDVLRVLKPGGVLALLDYPRDERGSPAAAAVEAFLRRFGAKAYVRPDYEAELEREVGFEVVEQATRAVSQRMTTTDLAALILSSSHARAAEAALGLEGARDAAAALATDLADDEGVVAYGYVFRLVIARRRD